MAALLRTKRIAWIGALFVVGFALLLSYLSSRRYKSALDWVEHTHLVRVSLERVLSGMTDQESAVRGYVITGDAAFLRRREVAKLAVEREVAHCRSLVRDNAEQSARAMALERRVHEKIAFGDGVVAAREQGSPDKADELVGSPQSKLTMGRVRDAVGYMTAEEERLLVERRAASTASEHDTIVASAVVAFCLLGLLGLSFVTMQRDANELRRAATELAESEERYRLLVDNVTDLVLLHDAKGKLVYVSPSLEPLLGYSTHEGATLDVLSLVHPDDGELVVQQRESFRTGAATSAVVTCRLRRSDGEYRWFEFKATGIRDEHGALGHFQSLGRDVTARRELELRLAEQAEELRQLSLRDGLTGLYNRRGFLELSAQAVRIAERQKHQLAALFIDLDGLKGINDDLGHEQGDRAIGEAADLLRSTCRATDLIARLGGDEFVVLASDVDDASIAVLTTRLERALAEVNQRPDRDYLLSFSVGVACFDPLAPVPMEELLVEADTRMYEAKNRRRHVRSRSPMVLVTPAHGVPARRADPPS
jgi:diguanylate cyclase (GGDEF)-like protein/PAS domain S-box-containing protein